MEEKLIFTDGIGAAVDRIVAGSGAPDVFTIVDDNTARFCLPRLRESSQAVAASTVFTVKAGDAHKNLDAATDLWHSFIASGATRSSIVVNLGGGVVTDLGGFAASTFKRGMRYINVPTTLLGAVDAAVGGKTGINFGGLKNEIGVFSQPLATVVGTLFFATLPHRELLSGYAEMLKHALLSGPDALARALSFDISGAGHDSALLGMLRASIGVKTRIVASDPTERGPRKALNLGHTAGHAFESLAAARLAPVPHGYAVACGCVVELVLSHLVLGFPSETLYQVAAFVKENYGGFAITCDDYPRLLEFMRHDKKNLSRGAINFTLLRIPGDAHTDCTVDSDNIRAALDIYRDLIL